MGIKKVTGIKEVDSIVAALNSDFKKDIFTLGPRYSSAEVFTSGSLALDAVLGIGGVPKDKIVEIYGEESVGKTSLILQFIKQYVEKYGYGRIPAFIDLERTTGLDLIKGIGLDPDRMLFCYPDTAEEAFQTAINLGLSTGIGLVAFDSVDAAQTEADVNRNIGDTSVAELPRIMAKSMRKISKICVDKEVCYLFANQIRMKIGVMYGDPRTVSGGKSLPYYSSLRLEVSSKRSKDTDNLLDMRVKVIKNKLAPAGKKAEFNFMCGRGTDPYKDTFDFAKKLGLLRLGGPHVITCFPNEEEETIDSGGNLGGRNYLIKHPDFYNRLREACLSISRIGINTQSDEEYTEGDVELKEGSSEAETVDESIG